MCPILGVHSKGLIFSAVMRSKISFKTKQEIRILYSKGSTIKDIAKKFKFKVSRSSVDALVKINPATGQFFESIKEYHEYLLMKKINPETEENYKSLREYNDYRARKKFNPKTGENYNSMYEFIKYQNNERSKRK